MVLRRLRLERFRAFDEVEIEIPEHGLLLVAGANNSGKTALLSAIDVVAGHQVSSPRHHGAAAPAQIEAEFHLSREERAGLLGDHHHAPIWLASSRFLERIVYRFTEDAAGMFYVSSLATEGSTGGFEDIARATPGSTFQQAHILQLNISGLVTGYRDPQDAGALSQHSMSALGSGGPDALRTGGFGSTLLAPWSAQVYHFNAIRTGTPRKSSFGDVKPELDPSGSNLAQCLIFHSSQESAVWHRLRRVMAAVLPDVGVLVAPMAGGEVEVAFVDPNSQERRNLKDLGSGVEQLLMIAYLGVSHPTGGLVLMEEPETSLHPGAQRELLRHLRKWSEDRIFIATTHSPVLLDTLPASHGHTILVTREHGASTAVTADEDLGAVLNAVGVRLSDVLSAERVVLVEGDSDVDVLRAWFPDPLLDHRCAVVPLGGSDRAYHLDTIKQVLSGVDQLGRSVLFLRDRDELGQRRLPELEADQRILVLARREIENYLLDDSAAVVEALESRARQPGRETGERFDEDSLARSMREEADALQRVVILKRVIEGFEPPRLLDRATTRRLVATDPSLEGLQATLDDALAHATRSRDQLAAAWATEEAAIAGCWDQDWMSLAPGAEVLGAIWRRAGFRYDKASDGAQIASAMKHPPAEIVDALDDLLDRSEHTSAV